MLLGIEHASFAWRQTQVELGWWSEAGHAAFPAPLRDIIATLLIVAQSTHAHTRARSCGLWNANRRSLYALFRWIARLNYFELPPSPTHARSCVVA